MDQVKIGKFIAECRRKTNLTQMQLAEKLNITDRAISKWETGLSFNKGYTENGFAEKVFHLHLRYTGDNNELYFRDYLVEFLDIAREYERLKLLLWKEYEHNRDAYTNAKTEFVRKYTEQAKIIYGNRYR